MPDDDVAIIGSAVLLPQADDLDALHELLADGRDLVGQPTAERAHHNGGVPSSGYLSMAYLNRVDLFDHRFFGIPLREAELMDPHQRLALQLTQRAIENAGYAPAALRGSRTAVILGDPRSEYYQLYEDEDPQQVLGSLGAALAARVCYQFDFTGPAFIVDTACSSSMVAVAQAMRALRTGEAELAIAGGISVQTVLIRQQGHVPMRGVESTDGRCRPFDEEATGTVGGEGGGLVVLKPLRDALAAGDHVQAVLKGIAVNHNGYRMASMSAPSQVAQAEVISAAWRDAGIAAQTIGYVECHGSGTPLGDVVEVDGLRRAFVDAGVATPSCAIGSIKGNVGHLDSAAGITGLFKAMLSVRRGMRYATAHFRSPNPLIDFSGPVQVNPATRPWPQGDGTPRRAGLSSFGLSGTNVHAVLEQAPPTPPPPVARRDVELVTVSAKSPSALDRYRDRIAEFAERTEHDLRAVAHALNRGRDDYPYRIACTAETGAELAEALRAAAVTDSPAPENPPVVLLFSGDGGVDPDRWAELCSGMPELATEFEPRTEAARLVAVQFALYRQVRSLGLPDTHLVGSGAGNLTVRIARGDTSLADGLAAATDLEISTDVNQERLAAAVQGFVRDGAVLVEMGTDGVLSRMIRHRAPELGCVQLVVGTGRRDLFRQVGALYRLGARLDWDRYYAGAAVPRIEAPTYPFDPIRCWCRPAGAPADEARPVVTEAPAPIAGGTDGIERRLAEVWQRVLGVERVESNSDYFALGGTSIAGITVLRTMERDFDVALTFADLYAHPTVADFAGRVATLRAARSTSDDRRPITPVPRGGTLPLSFGQEQLWYLDRLNPGTALYNIPHDLRLTGPLDVDAITWAVRALVARHEVLRTCVPHDEGVPFTRVRTEEAELPVIDLSTLAEPDRRREATRIIDEAAIRPFDLAEGPLVRTTLLRLAEQDHVLLWTYHHIVFDGWSPTVFFRDFGELYHARLTGREPELPALAIQYADFAAWQRDLLTGGKLDRSLDFWRAELAGLDRPELPLDRPRPPVQTFEGDLLEFSLDATRADRVRRFSQRHGVTTFVTMLALVDTLLYRWGGLTDVVVGVGTSGRVNPATHDLIGYFNNLPPFRTRLEGSLRFTDLVRRCAATVAGVLDHEEIPFEKIVSAVCRRREPNRHPLFDVAYTYQNVPQDTAELAGLTCSRYLDGNIVGIAPGTAKFDLTVGVIDQQRGPMDGYLEYAVALFDRDTIMGLAQGLPALLDSALDDPERSLDGLDWPEGEDRPAVTVPGPVRLFEEWAARRPEQPAIRAADGRTLTYRELNRWANRLARRLAAAGVGPDVAVPVVAERGPGLVAGWLAVAKAGGAYVPIDPSVPAARVNELVAATDARIVLTDMELEFESTSDSDDEDPADVTAPAGLAYVAYTSGSTGPPQGCAIERRNLAHLVCWYRDTAGITEHDRLLQAVSPGFDATVLEIWAALGSGATLCFLPSIFTEPHELLHWLAEQRITVAFLPTPLAEVVLTDCRWPAGLRLRVLCTGGDRLRCRPPADTPFRVLNAYGPTECTVAASAGPVDPGSADVVPDIGRPITGAAVRLLDRQGRIVPSGQWGEIHIGGPTVGRGYHRNPGLTASRFVADPFAGRPGARMYRTGDLARSRPDGTLEFGGRLDDQVEVRGQRVEPAEIERALATHPRVRGALVVPSLAPSGSTRLVAHVTGDVTDPQELRAWAGDRLPGYLVPSDFVLRDSLPVTPNGKIDRRSLRTMPPPSPVASPVDSMQPRRAERVLTELCAELLGRQQVSARDNFFDLGGDSVLGVRVAARAAKAGVHFTPQQLLQCHTVGELAAVAVVEPETTGPVGAAARHVALDASDDVAKPIPLTPVIRSFLERMPDGATDFIEVHPLETVPEVRADTVRTAVQHLVAQHEPLRYRLRRNDLGTHIECHQVDLARVFDTRVLPPLSPDDEYDVIAADCQAMKSEIDVAHGPLIRVRHYDRGRTRGGLVVLLIHHFVFDNMSTVVLIDELDALLSDILAGKEPAEQPRAARWREWARHLTDMSVSDELAAELMYWTATLRAGSATGSFAGPQAGGLADRTIAPEQVAPVLAAGAAEGREAALSAVARGLARWRGTSCAYLMTEGDATPNAFRLAGRGPSFGWFTTLHPLVLPVEPGSTARDCIAEATERIRSVPNDGVGYGILRHLTPDSPAVARLRSLPEPEVMVVHAPSDTGGFDRGVRLLRTRWDLEVNLKQSVTAWFPVIVSTKVRDGALRLAVTSRRGVSQEDLDSLADEIVLAVTELART